MVINPPKNLIELQQRCQQITGQTIGHLAETLRLPVPSNLLHAKGWMGQLIELHLGASAASKALPDFPDLGIELKTVPVDGKNKPLESTYVCTVQANEFALNWHESWVCQKLKHVLWVPVRSDKSLPIAKRVIQSPIFWHMDAATENTMRTDWEELMEMLQLGYGKELSAKYGTILHIRPKAANSKTLINYVDAQGQDTKIVPKGFYLRANFTREILARLP
ncbi:MAG TPA: DNA mismatch repair endonuclease MutH [Gammaproteobacteria bacterium]|nr:DNA mismatch repair endonuclease MutH [Gammaproteobacteria bacterium]